MPYVVVGLICLLLGTWFGAAGASKLGKMDRKGHVDAVQQAVLAVMSTDYFRTRVLKELGLEDDFEEEDEDLDDGDEAPVIPKYYRASDIGRHGPFGPSPVRRRR